MADSDGRIIIDVLANIDSAVKDMQSMGQHLLKTKLQAEAMITGFKALGRTIIDFGVDTIKAGIEFESAFAGVIKTVDGTEAQLAELKTGIREMAMEIPASTTAIAEVAENAGQLGIATDNILSFSEVMIGLGESTNIGSAEAAQSLAQFANIVQMSQSDFDRLGSVIVDLGNNFATTERDIVAMGQRLAGAGSQIGMSEANIMSFATALASVGIEAEAGGSAFSKAMTKIDIAVANGEGAVSKFASVAKMSAEDFIKLWEKDAAAAMVALVEGLGTVSEEGGNLNLVLDDLGFTELRLMDAMKRAAGASDLFAKAVEDGNVAWEENKALQDEVSKRYDTTESKMKLAANAFNDVKITISEGLLPSLAELSESFVGFVQDNQDNIIAFGETVTGLFTFIVDNAGAVATAMTGVVTGLTVAKTAFSAFAGPIGWATALISAGTLAYGHFKRGAEEAAEAQEALRQELLNSGDAFEDLRDDARNASENLNIGTDTISQYKELKSAINEAGLSVEEKAEKQQQLAEVEQTLIALSDGLISKTDMESGAIESLLPVLDEQLKLKKEMAEFEAGLFMQTHSVEMIESQIEASQKAYDATKAEFDLMSSAYPEINYLVSEYQQHMAASNEKSDEARAVWGRLSEAFAEAGYELSEYYGDVKNLDSTTRAFNGRMSELQQTLYDQHTEIINGKAQLIKYKELLGENEAAIIALNRAFESGAISEGVYLAEMESLTRSGQKLKTGIEDVTDALNEQPKTVKELGAGYDNLATNLSDVKDETDFLKSAVNTLTDGLILEESQVNELITLYPELADYVEKTGDITFDNGKKIIDIHDDLAISSEAVRQAAIKRAETEVEAAITAINAYEEQRKGMLKLAETGTLMSGIYASEAESLGLNIDYQNRKLQESQALLNKLKDMGPIVASSIGGGFSGAGSSAKKAIDETGRKAEESAADMNRLLESLTTAIQDEAKETYDTNIDLMDKDISLFKQLKNDTITFTQKAADENGKILEQSLDGEHALIESAEYDKLEVKRDYAEREYDMYSDSQIEIIGLMADEADKTLELLDRKEDANNRVNVAALEGINDQIDKQMEYISLTDQALYEKLTALSKEEQTLVDIMGEEDRLREENARNERRRKYQERIDNAKTDEERIRAIEELAKYEEDLRQKDKRADDKKALEDIKEKKQDAIKEATDTIKIAEKEIEKELAKGAEIVSTIVDNYANVLSEAIQLAFNASKNDASKTGISLLLGEEEGIKKAFETLMKYSLDWSKADMGLEEMFKNAIENGLSKDGEREIQEAWDKFSGIISGYMETNTEDGDFGFDQDEMKRMGIDAISNINKGADEMAPTLIYGMRKIGDDAMDGILQAIKAAAPGITRELESLANAILNALRGKKGFDEESPSKKTYAIGEFAGEGLVLGTVNKAKAMLPKIHEMANGITGAISFAGNSIGMNAPSSITNTNTYTTTNYNTEMPVTFDNVDMRGQSDIVAVSESLSFLSRQAISGKGGRRIG